MQRHVRWRTIAAVFMLLGCALPVLARLAAGPQGADIHVEWRPAVDEATRERLAARYRLERPRKLPDPNTWRYDLIDPSRDNIEALVNDPAIEDTHEIDRGEYILAPTAPRTSRQLRLPGWGDTLVGMADGLAIGLIGLAALALATGTPPAQFLVRGIPELDASATGLFRIVFGSAALAFFATHRVDSSWLTATFDLEIDGPFHAVIIDWLRVHPGIVDGLTPWLMLTGVAFIAGLMTRVTYPLFVCGVLVRAFVAVTLDSTHPQSSLVLTLVALLPSRWGDGLSVDAWLRRRGVTSGSPAPASWTYGYSVWVPGLVLGVAWAAAVWAKLTVPPGVTDWVLNGTVKYHFITDSANAPLTWGLQFAKHPFLAILASLAAITIEGILITAAFRRSEWYRLALGAGALSLFCGFFLFMGVFWPAWWMLLMGFLPWQTLSRRLRATEAKESSPPAALRERRTIRWLPAVQQVFIALVVAQQLVSSALRLERAPMFSWYDMYSGTFASPEEWNASRQPSYRVVLYTDRGRSALSTCNPYGEFVAEFQRALEGSAEASSKVWQALRGCSADVVGARAVALEGDIRTFDWDRLVFTVDRAAAMLGPLPADTATASMR